jgi:hypothetical protein
MGLKGLKSQSTLIDHPSIGSPEVTTALETQHGSEGYITDEDFAFTGDGCGFLYRGYCEFEVA